MQEALARAGASCRGGASMSRADRDRWDARYRTGGHSRTPSRFVVAHAPPSQGARAIDVACGAGRNTLHLAQLGYHIDAVDVSPEALTLLGGEAERLGLADRITLIEADLDAWRPAANSYALAVQIGFYDPRLLLPLQSAVVPGGLVIIETLNLVMRTRRIDFALSHAMERGTLAAAFARWDILRYSDSAGAFAERSHIVARRPPRR